MSNLTQNLVEVTKQKIGTEEVNAVNARDLWHELEVGRDFSNWIKARIDKYGFVKDIDFVTVKNGGGESRGFQPIDYLISLGMAKELAMVENRCIICGITGLSSRRLSNNRRGGDMNTYEKLQGKVFQSYDEEFQEWVLGDRIYVFIEDGFTGTFTEIRAMTTEGFKDRDGDLYPFPEDLDTIITLKSFDWSE